MALLKLRDAAARLGVCPTTLRRWHHAGRLRAVRLPGGHLRVDPAEIKRLTRNGQ